MDHYRVLISSQQLTALDRLQNLLISTHHISSPTRCHPNHAASQTGSKTGTICPAISKSKPTFPRAFSHGPLSLGGLALPDCTPYNISYRTYLLLHVLSVDNDTGRHLRTSIDWSQPKEIFYSRYIVP